MIHRRCLLPLCCRFISSPLTSLSALAWPDRCQLSTGEDAQKDSPTASKEFTPGEQQLFCAINKSKDVLRAFAGCVHSVTGTGTATAAAAGGGGGGGGGCGFPMMTIGDALSIEGGAASELAGGSAVRFAKPGLGGRDDTDYYKKSVGGVELIVPVGRELWGKSSRGQELCGGDKPMKSKSPTGMGVYRDRTFNQYAKIRG